jgi:hypothetical protein
MPTLPKDVSFLISEQFKVTNDEQEFIVIDHIYGKEQKRIILFSGPEQFKLLCTSAQLFTDGTFAVTPRPFKQTYIVQALHESGIGEFYFQYRNWKLCFSLFIHVLFVFLLLFSIASCLDFTERQENLDLSIII